MKSREPRRNVMIRARMRQGGPWADVSIRNISSRGLLVQMPVAVARGAYVELRRGRHQIVARVAWAGGRQCGLHTQDRLDIEAIIAEPDLSATDFKAAVAARPDFERRAAARVPTHLEVSRQAERSRLRARALEFAGITTVALILVLCLAGGVWQVLAAPMASASAALHHR